MRTASLLPQSGRFRHVVFADALVARRAVDFGPRADASPGAAAGGGQPRRRTTPAAPPLSRGEHDFLAWLFAAARLDVGRYRPETLGRRLAACLRAVRADDVTHARRLLDERPALRPAALGAVVIGVTQFFRDGPFFSHLAAHVLPELALRREPEAPKPRVWSVGCSDGCELYSVALLLAEAGALGGCDLLGTDCRADAVARAREGIFDAHAVRHVPPGLLARHFRPEGGRWRVAPEIRAAVRWRTADALAVREPGAWDMVLCRNVSIYLRPEASRDLWRELEAALRPGGVLALGKAERPTGAGRLAPAGPCLYRRCGTYGANDAA